MLPSWQISGGCLRVKPETFRGTDLLEVSLVLSRCRGCPTELSARTVASHIRPTSVRNGEAIPGWPA